MTIQDKKNKRNEYMRLYYLTHKQSILKRNKKYKDSNKEKVKITIKNWIKNNPDKFDSIQKKWKSNNKKKISEIAKKQIERVKLNPFLLDKKRKLRRENIKRKKEIDKKFHLHFNIRTAICNSLHLINSKKTSKTTEILGCSIQEFKSYLESKFESWMNWDNYGKYRSGELNYGWDLDHIIPISTAKTEEDVIRLNHHTNFQPLCSYTNRHIKTNKI